MESVDWLVDCVIALGAFGFGLIQLTLSVNMFLPDDFTRRILGIKSIVPSTGAVIATLITCLPLVFRRKLPWPVLVITLLGWILFSWPAGVSAALLVSLFTLTYERGRTETIAASAITLVIVLLVPYLGQTTALTTLYVLQNAAFTVAVAFAGYALHSRQEYAQAVEARAIEAEKLRASEEKRAVEAERTRDTEARRRVEAERVRIAREVHDITAHSLSAVSIQAALAERVIDTDPEAAKEAIQNVRKTSKEALDEMRAMVGVLRSEGSRDAVGDSDAEKEPTKGTAQMNDLVDYLQAAGIDCSLDTTAFNKAQVPAYIDIALYGIAREAVTNILRHSHAEKAKIRLWTENNMACICIEDDGQGIAEFPLNGHVNDEISTTSGGHGVEGMNERANVLGGSFSIESAPGSGTCILVKIPIAGSSGTSSGVSSETSSGTNAFKESLDG